MSAIRDAGVGWWGEGGFGLGLGACLGGRGGAFFSLGGWGSFLLRTGESAKQAETFDVREEAEEEEESVEDSEEVSEEDWPGSLFLFFGGLVWKGLWVLGWHLFCFRGFVLPWGLVFVLGWGAGFGAKVGGWGGGGSRVAGGEQGPRPSRQCCPSPPIASPGRYYGRPNGRPGPSAPPVLRLAAGAAAAARRWRRWAGGRIPASA